MVEPPCISTSTELIYYVQKRWKGIVIYTKYIDTFKYK